MTPHLRCQGMKEWAEGSSLSSQVRAGQESNKNLNNWTPPTFYVNFSKFRKITALRGLPWKCQGMKEWTEGSFVSCQVRSGQDSNKKFNNSKHKQLIPQPVLDRNLKERFLKEQPCPIVTALLVFLMTKQIHRSNFLKVYFLSLGVYKFVSTWSQLRLLISTVQQLTT